MQQDDSQELNAPANALADLMPEAEAKFEDLPVDEETVEAIAGGVKVGKLLGVNY